MLALSIPLVMSLDLKRTSQRKRKIYVLNGNIHQRPLNEPIAKVQSPKAYPCA